MRQGSHAADASFAPSYLGMMNRIGTEVAPLDRVEVARRTASPPADQVPVTSFAWSPRRMGAIGVKHIWLRAPTISVVIPSA